MKLSKKQYFYLKNILLHALMVIVAVLMLAPFFWMVGTALKTEENAMRIPPQIIPDPFTFEILRYVLTLLSFWRSTLISLIIAVSLTAGTLITSSMAGFAFAKIPFHGKGVIFSLFLGTMMIPGPILMIPLYMLYAKIQWVDTPLPLIIPGIMINITGGFLMRQFMAGIPNSYLESARVDGGGYVVIFLVIILPLCKAVLATIALMTFIGSWNDFMGALIYLSDPNTFTLPLLLATFRSTQYEVSWGSVMALSTLAVIPTVVMFLAGQKFFTQGVVLTGLKA